MYRKYRKVALFFVIYIKEAHAADSRSPVRGAPNQPKTLVERFTVASTCAKSMKLSIPFLIDDMKNSADKQYSGWPDRMYVIGGDGKVAYKGARGPWGFKPKDAEKSLLELLRKR